MGKIKKVLVWVLFFVILLSLISGGSYYLGYNRRTMVNSNRDIEIRTGIEKLAELSGIAGESISGSIDTVELIERIELEIKRERESAERTIVEYGNIITEQEHIIDQLEERLSVGQGFFEELKRGISQGETSLGGLADRIGKVAETIEKYEDYFNRVVSDNYSTGD